MNRSGSRPCGATVQLAITSQDVLSDALGAKRQVFYVTLGSFDTHGRQKELHGDLTERLAHALAWPGGSAWQTAS